MSQRYPTCTKCSLHKATFKVCTWGEGPKPCKVMLVGIALGNTENKFGRPFLGPAGDKLNEVLNFFKINRSEVYISNLVKCLNPPGHSLPKESITACLLYLKEEIEEVKPDLILAIGAEPFKALTGKEEIIKNIGKLFPLKWDSLIQVAPAIHPAAILRKTDAGLYKSFLRSFLVLRKWLDNTLVDKNDYGIYNIDPTDKQIFQLFSEINERKSCTIDIETNSLNVYHPGFQIRCIGITTREREAMVIRWDRLTEDMKGDLKKILLDPSITLTGHNIKYDLHGLCRILNLDNFQCQIDDSILLHYLLYDYKPHNLSDLAWEYTKMGGYDIQSTQAGGAHLLDMETLLPYCGGDVDVTTRIRNTLAPLVVQDKTDIVYKHLLLPATKTFFKMERRGVKADRAYLENLYKTLEEKKNGMIIKLHDFSSIHSVLETGVADTFNPRSHPQMLKLASLLEIDSFKKTKTGEDSIDAEVLAYYAEQYPELQLIKDWRTLASIQSHIDNETTEDTFLKSIAEDGRIHTSFNLFIARSGRSAAARPNLQNLPVRLMDTFPEFNIRNFLVADDDYVFVSADYSLHELRVMAALSNDVYLKNLIKQGKDPHADMGAAILGMQYEEFIEQLALGNKEVKGARADGKSINFGVIYGLGPKRLSYQLGKTLGEAKKRLALHKLLHPNYYIWKNEMEAFMVREKYAPLITGRKRRLPNITADDSEGLRKLINALIQGPASDILLMALIGLDNFFTKNHMKSMPILAIHDEVILLVHKDELAGLKEQIHPILINPPGFNLSWLKDVELAVEFSMGTRLGDLNDY